MSLSAGGAPSSPTKTAATSLWVGSLYRLLSGPCLKWRVTCLFSLIARSSSSCSTTCMYLYAIQWGLCSSMTVSISWLYTAGLLLESSLLSLPIHLLAGHILVCVHQLDVVCWCVLRPGGIAVCAPNEAKANPLLYFRMFVLKLFACTLEPRSRSFRISESGDNWTFPLWQQLKLSCGNLRASQYSQWVVISPT